MFQILKEKAKHHLNRQLSQAARDAFLRLDADLYSSTKTVLDLLGDGIIPGTVIAFDEFFNYPAWREGEYRAFTEFCRERQAEMRYFGFVGRDEQVAAKVTGVAPVSDPFPVEEYNLTPVVTR